MRSLEKQLPLAAFLLLALVAASITLMAYRDVRATTRELYGERLMRLAGQLASTLGSSVLRTRAELVDAASDPAVVRLLADPGSGIPEAASAVLARVAPDVQNSVVTGAWDLSGDVVATASNTDMPDWLLIPPPLVDSPTVTPLNAVDDSLLEYGIVAPVRDGRRLVGFVQVRQRIGGGAGGGRGALAARVGEATTLLLGSPGGAWTDFRTPVERPPSELIGATETVAYERGGTARMGFGQPLTDTGLILVTEIEESAALASSRAFLRRVGLIAVIAVLLATVGAWVLGRRITVPLAYLRNAAESMGKGDYAQRAWERGHFEIARVARTFNKMATETESQVRALKASEERFRSLVTATAQVVLWTNPEGSITEPLPSWQSYTGLSFEDTRGSGWTTALHPDDAATALSTWREAVRSKSLYAAEYRVRRHDGEYRQFVVRFVPVLDREGTIREWVGTGTDITDQRETEEKLSHKELELQRAQRLDAIGRLAGGIAHDFNNLLTTIQVPAELAQQALAEDDPVQEDLTDIRDAARRAGELTKKLLAFGRQQVMSPSLLDVNEAVEGTTRLLKRVLGESISLEFVPGAAEATVVADPTQFEQIILNLAVNARDAMPAGGQLTIETANSVIDQTSADEHTDLEPGRYVVVAVTDTGMGMDRETQARIFEPFFTTKSDDKGTGLGLATVYGIVRQSGGHILVYSEVGQGTSFKVLLPFASEMTAESAPTRQSVEGGAAPAGTETILLAEDEEGIRRLAVRILSGLGYKVIPASGGEEALQLAANHGASIDILVTDVVMPEMNGLELWERLRLERPTLPALFLSGWASSAVVRHGILDGQIPFLQKPFSAYDLGLAVKDVLDGV